MAGIEIPCPQCGMRLRLPNRTLLGKRGKCGKCGHKFVLAEPAPTAPEPTVPAPADPNEVKFELVEPPASPPVPQQPMMGTAARWVADSQAPGSPQAPAQPQGYAPGYAPQPQGYAPQPQGYAPQPQGYAPQPQGYAPQPQGYAAEPAFPSFTPNTPPLAAEDDGLDRIRLRQRRQKRKSQVMAGIGVVALLVGIGAYLWLEPGGSATSRAASRSAKQSSIAARESTDEQNVEVAEGGYYGEEDRPAVAAVNSPTQGDPISLKLIPAGSRVVVNLRPAELWKTGTPGEEVLACLGPLGIWMGQMLEQHCLAKPADIEEVLICVIPAMRGDPPDIALVVHTQQEIKRSEMLERFNARLMEDLSRPYYASDDKAYYMADSKTYAIVPRSMAQDMLDAIDQPSVTGEGIQELLSRTDRKRHVTIVCEPLSVRIDAPFLAPANAQPLLAALVDWFGDDIDNVAWSCHLGETFYSELVLRGRELVNPRRIESSIQKHLDEMPHEILSLVERMNPPTAGPRKIIGRFPAMSKVFAMSTAVGLGGRLVSLRTGLPERAAPNLALAGLLTWDESTRTDFSKAPPKRSTEAAMPDLLADRLRKRIDVDFRNDPLHQALDFIAEETGTKFKIEGNDLKMVGITQNMKQQFKMDNTPATAVLDHMLTGLGLVIVVDEQQKLITVTSAKAAADKKLTAFPLK